MGTSPSGARSSAHVQHLFVVLLKGSYDRHFVGEEPETQGGRVTV